MGFGSSEVSTVSRPAPFASARQLSLSFGALKMVSLTIHGSLVAETTGRRSPEH